MSAPTYDAAGETEARTGGAVPEHRVISQRAIAEMDVLHREVLATKPPKPWSPIALRRRHRAARVAEADFLRALGFEDWETYVAFVNPQLASVLRSDPDPAPDVDLVAPETAARVPGADGHRLDEGAPDLGDIAELVRLVLHQVAETRADLRVLQASSAHVDEVLDRALMEIVALRLELIVAARRAGT
jgi:hypothetical protein